MSQYVDINQLTREVLASVAEDTREKTASEVPGLKTEIGEALKQAATNIRSYEDTAVTNADLQTVIAGAKVAVFGGNTTGAQTAGGLAGMGAGAVAGGALGTMIMPGVGTALGGIAGGMLGSNVGSNTAQAASNMTQSGAVQPMNRTASALGNELRKVAQQIREQGATNEEIRLTKAAQMLTAAVGLSHLTEGLK